MVLGEIQTATSTVTYRRDVESLVAVEVKSRNITKHLMSDPKENS